MRTLFCFLVLVPCTFVVGKPSGDLLFHAGFSKLTEKPQTAPYLPVDTQPVPDVITQDFNNLKDPKFTPTFEVRNPVKFQVPGFSTCIVNVNGSMEIDLVKDKDFVWMHGSNPKVNGYIGKRFLGKDATGIEVFFNRAEPGEGGTVSLTVSDVVSNAYLMLASFRGEDNQGAYALAYSETGAWEDWKTWINGQGVDWTKPVKFAIAKVGVDSFQAFINDKPAGPAVTLKNLKHVTQFQLGCDARIKGVRVFQVDAYRDEKLVEPTPSMLKIGFKPETKSTFTPANPYGSGIQIDYPFHGSTDAMADPKIFDELAGVLKELHTKLIRFPGGASAYCYSIHGPESMDAFQEVYGGYPLDRKVFAWSDVRQFFKLCKAIGADAIFQLNLGYWYDPKTKKAYRIAIQDSNLVWPADGPQPIVAKIRPLEYHLDKYKFALEDAKTIAKWAKEIGVKVLWEFGNEDSGYFTPKTYVEVSKGFYDAIRQVDPKAEFIIYGDGITWSDWTWPYMTFDEMKKAGLEIAYTSHHQYMFGGTAIPFDTGENSYNGIVAAWANIAHLHQGVRKKLDSLGYTKTKLAMTEGNMAVAGPMVGQPLEHSMGRALGEARIFVPRIRTYATLVHHDLARNGPENGTWFCRIFYFPKNEYGKKYVMPLPAQVMKTMHQHGLREVVYDGDGVTASQASDGLLISAGNPLPLDRRIELTLTGFAAGADKVVAQALSSESLDTPEFKTANLPVELKRAGGDTAVSIVVPKYTFCHFAVK